MAGKIKSGAKKAAAKSAAAKRKPGGKGGDKMSPIKNPVGAGGSGPGPKDPLKKKKGSAPEGPMTPMAKMKAVAKKIVAKIKK